MRIGTPPSSVNCLVDAGFLLWVRGAEAIRVPKPAAGTITITFIAGCKYTRVRAAVQIGPRGLIVFPHTGFALPTFCSDLGNLLAVDTTSSKPRHPKLNQLNNLHVTKRVNTVAVQLHC